MLSATRSSADLRHLKATGPDGCLVLGLLEVTGVKISGVLRLCAGDLERPVCADRLPALVDDARRVPAAGKMSITDVTKIMSVLGIRRTSCKRTAEAQPLYGSTAALPLVLSMVGRFVPVHLRPARPRSAATVSFAMLVIVAHWQVS